MPTPRRRPLRFSKAPLPFMPATSPPPWWKRLPHRPGKQPGSLAAGDVRCGIVPLVNSVNRLKIGTDYIYLAGIDDVDNGWPDLEGVAAQVDRNDYAIFLSHSPAILGKALDARDRDGDKGWLTWPCVVTPTADR